MCNWFSIDAGWDGGKVQDGNGKKRHCCFSSYGHNISNLLWLNYASKYLRNLDVLLVRTQWKHVCGSHQSGCKEQDNVQC